MTFLTLQRITYEAGANVYRYQTGCLVLDRKSLRLCNLERPSGSVYIAANHYSEQNNRYHLETLPGQAWVGHSLNYPLRQAHHLAHQPAPPDCPPDHDVSFCCASAYSSDAFASQCADRLRSRHDSVDYQDVDR